QRTYGSEMPGLSVFVRRKGGEVFHTYSTYARGLEAFNAAYRMIDLTPRGRDEARPMDWLQYHDEYDK
ncbi:MAG: DUF899 domain-containing protein, partial [Candidatus Devosia euplotis]|nr:DUF899 domain-containing protein [Candidatus Devosia euplotis]